jgi:hypothetical protein
VPAGPGTARAPRRCYPAGAAPGAGSAAFTVEKQQKR